MTGGGPLLAAPALSVVVMTGPIMLDASAPAGGKASADDDYGWMTTLGVVLVTLSAISGLLFGYDTGVVSGPMLLVRHTMKLTARADRVGHDRSRLDLLSHRRLPDRYGINFPCYRLI